MYICIYFNVLSIGVAAFHIDNFMHVQITLLGKGYPKSRSGAQNACWFKLHEKTAIHYAPANFTEGFMVESYLQGTFFIP
jgi:hypothetical protein